MGKLLIGVLATALMIPAGWALAGSLDRDGNHAAFQAGTTTGRTTTVGTTTNRATTTDRDRRAGKADRGRRNRGRRAGVRRDDRVRPRVREAGEDVRGPCDEAEHRNDPRCTGAAGRDDDRRGGDDNGRGRDDDRSGRRGGDDDGNDDRSGRGGGRGSDD
jgi:hypothetical protein